MSGSWAARVNFLEAPFLDRFRVMDTRQSGDVAPSAHIEARATGSGQRTLNPPDDASASGPELRDDRCDVVVLFLKTESLNMIHDCGQQLLAWQVAMLLKRFNQA